MRANNTNASVLMCSLRTLAVAAFVLALVACDTASAQKSDSAFRGVRIARPAVVRASMADAVADGIAAVNTRFCDRTSGYASFSNENDPTVQYLLRARFRHVRDGGTNCLGDTSFAAFASRLYRVHDVDMLSTIEPCASDTDIRDLIAKFPGVRAVEGPNEYDYSKPSVVAAGSVSRGERTIGVSADARSAFAIGQQYRFGEGPSQEQVVVAQCSGRNAVVVAAPLENAHAAGFTTNLTAAFTAGSQAVTVRDAGSIRDEEWITLDCESHSTIRETAQVTRIDGSTIHVEAGLRYGHSVGATVARSCLATPNGFASDLTLLYRRIAAIVRAAGSAAPIPIVADSQASQTDNAAFAGSQIARFEDVGNLHDYPGQRNPGGASGDGTQGFGDEFLGCGPYGAYWFNMCAESLQFQFSGAGRSIKPLWTTEISYNVAPVGGPWNAQQHPIPDDVAVKYLPRLELFYLMNGHARIYWFELVDSASGCGNAFAQYGLVRRSCPSADVVSPKAEYIALADMIAFFSDTACRYPACSFRTGNAAVTASTSASDVQYDVFQKRDGTYVLAFWRESPGYEPDSTQPCRLTLSCYIAVAPAKVAFSIKGEKTFRKPVLQTFETRPKSSRFGHITAPVATMITASGQWNGTATDTVTFLSWRGARP